jgi:hypothetical protein
MDNIMRGGIVFYEFSAATLHLLLVQTPAKQQSKLTLWPISGPQQRQSREYFVYDGYALRNK